MRPTFSKRTLNQFCNLVSSEISLGMIYCNVAAGSSEARRPTVLKFARRTLQNAQRHLKPLTENPEFTIMTEGIRVLRIRIASLGG